MSDTPQTTAAPSAAPMSRRQLLTQFSGLLLLMLLASLDQTIVATALPTVAGELGSLDALPWVVTSYLVASVAATPILGKLGDLFGRQRLLLVSAVVFIVGSLACGLAQDIGSLVAFRAVQGAGAGGMIALAMASVGDLVAPRERGRYQGYIQATFALASVAGPLTGGLLVDTIGWRWIFYVNLPIGVIALVVLARLLGRQAPRRAATVDYLGATLFVGAVVSLMLVLTWGGQAYAWTSPVIVVLGAAAVGLGVVFVWWETRAAEPILPPRMLRTPVVAVAGVTMFTTSVGFFAVIVYVPLFVQVVLGSDATTAGLLLLPLTLGIVASTTVSGRLITRTGRYKIFPIVGLAMMTVAMVLFSTMTADTPYALVACYQLVLGLGFGQVTQVLVLAVQNSVDPRMLGTATASTNFFRGLGGAVGVALFGAVLSSHTVTGGPGRPPTGVPSSPEQLRALPAAARDAAIGAFADGLHAVFLLAVPFTVIALVATCFLVEIPLRSGPPRGR